MKLPISGNYSKDWPQIGDRVRSEAGGICIRCGHSHDPADGYALTVHHFTGNKSNNEWWNLMALCQRCHLKVQGRVNPDIPYFLEHSAWAKPYIAGFYAHKYEGRNITRAEALARMDELTEIKSLAYNLLMKREFDGLNGRTWDAHEHLTWETQTRLRLRLSLSDFHST